MSPRPSGASQPHHTQQRAREGCAPPTQGMWGPQKIELRCPLHLPAQSSAPDVVLPSFALARDPGPKSPPPPMGSVVKTPDPQKATGKWVPGEESGALQCSGWVTQASSVIPSAAKPRTLMGPRDPQKPARKAPVLGFVHSAWGPRAGNAEATQLPYVSTQPQESKSGALPQLLRGESPSRAQPSAVTQCSPPQSKPHPHPV